MADQTPTRTETRGSSGSDLSSPIAAPAAAAPSRATDPIHAPAFGNQVLPLIAQAARVEDSPPSAPSDQADPSDDDYLRIELDGWDNDNEEDGENEIELRNEDDNNQAREEENRDLREEAQEGNDDMSVTWEEREEDDDLRWRRRNVLRLQLRDLAVSAENRRIRIPGWAEILMGLDLENHSIEGEGYIGNAGDYVDAARYEALLQNLAENEGGRRRGAPPASKAAIEALETIEINSEGQTLACAVCKDVVGVGEMLKKLPCGHGYHEDCIFPWLGSRNSCPVCRFELPTDDSEYEEQRKKRTAAAAATATSTSTSTSSGGSGSSDYEAEFF